MVSNEDRQKAAKASQERAAAETQQAKEQQAKIQATSSRTGLGQGNRGYNYSSTTDNVIKGSNPQTGAYYYDQRTQQMQGNIPNDMAQKIEPQAVKNQIRGDIAQQIKAAEEARDKNVADYIEKAKTTGLNSAEQRAVSDTTRSLNQTISDLKAQASNLKEQGKSKPNYSGVMATSGKIYESAAEAKRQGATVAKTRTGQDVTFEGDIRSTAGYGQSNRGYDYKDTTDSKVIHGAEKGVAFEILKNPEPLTKTGKVPVQADFTTNFITGKSETGFPKNTNNNIILNRTGTGTASDPFKTITSKENQLAFAINPKWEIDTKQGKKTFEEKSDLEKFIKQNPNQVIQNDKPISKYNDNFITRKFVSVPQTNGPKNYSVNLTERLEGQQYTIQQIDKNNPMNFVSKSNQIQSFRIVKSGDPLEKASLSVDDFLKRRKDIFSQAIGGIAQVGISSFGGIAELGSIVRSKTFGREFLFMRPEVKTPLTLDSAGFSELIGGGIKAYQTGDIKQLGIGAEKAYFSIQSQAKKQSLGQNLGQAIGFASPIIPGKVKSLSPIDYINVKLAGKEASKSIYRGLALKTSKGAEPLIGIQSRHLVLGHNPKYLPIDEIGIGSRYGGELALGSGGEKSVFYSPKTMKYLISENIISPQTARAARKAIELEDATQANKANAFVGTIDADAFKRISKTQGDYLLSKSAGLQKTDDIDKMHGSLATRISMSPELKKEAGGVLKMGDMDVVPKLTKTDIKRGVTMEDKASQLIKEYHKNFPLAKGERLEFTDKIGENRALTLVNPQGKKDKIFEIVVKQSDQTPIGQKSKINPTKVLDYKIPYDDTVKAVDYNIKAHTLTYQGLTQTKTILNWTKAKPRSILSNKPNDLQFHHLTKQSGKDFGILLTKDEHLGITALQGELGKIKLSKTIPDEETISVYHAALDQKTVRTLLKSGFHKLRPVTQENIDSYKNRSGNDLYYPAFMLRGGLFVAPSYSEAAGWAARLGRSKKNIVEIKISKIRPDVIENFTPKTKIFEHNKGSEWIIYDSDVIKEVRLVPKIIKKQSEQRTIDYLSMLEKKGPKETRAYFNKLDDEILWQNTNTSIKQKVTSDEVLNLLGERPHKKYPLTKGYGEKIESKLENPETRQEVRNILSEAASQVKDKEKFIGNTFKGQENTLQYSKNNKIEFYTEPGREKDFVRRYWQGRQSELNQLKSVPTQAKTTREKAEAFKGAHPELDFGGAIDEKVEIKFTKEPSKVLSIAGSINKKSEYARPLMVSGSSSLFSNRESIQPRSLSSLARSSVSPRSSLFESPKSSLSQSSRPSITPSASSSIPSSSIPSSSFVSKKPSASSKPSFSNMSKSIWSKPSSYTSPFSNRPSITSSSRPSIVPSTTPSIIPTKPIFNPITNPTQPIRRIPLFGDNKNRKKKYPNEKESHIDFLGNSKTNDIVGLFKRTEILRGDRLTNRQVVIDKKATFKKQAGLGFNKFTGFSKPKKFKL